MRLVMGRLQLSSHRSNSVSSLLLPHTQKGRTLLELTRAFYRDSAAHRMVYAFNHTPGEFDFQELCRELGISAAAAAANKPPPTHEP